MILFIIYRPQKSQYLSWIKNNGPTNTNHRIIPFKMITFKMIGVSIFTPVYNCIKKDRASKFPNWLQITFQEFFTQGLIIQENNCMVTNNSKLSIIGFCFTVTDFSIKECMIFGFTLIVDPPNELFIRQWCRYRDFTANGTAAEKLKLNKNMLITKLRSEEITKIHTCC